MELKELNIIFDQIQPADGINDAGNREISEIREVSAQSDEIAGLREIAAAAASIDLLLFTTT